MSNLFKNWCAHNHKNDGRKKLTKLIEKKDGRADTIDDVVNITTSHYASDEEISNWIELLGYETAASLLKEQYPQGATGRSADLGEILASEYIEDELYYTVPVKKLRDKDHREMAMRGEDVIGVGYSEKNELLLLKGEAKSAQSLSKNTIEKARLGLEKDEGRPTPHALSFIARRLMTSEKDDEIKIGTDLAIEATSEALPKTSIAHYMFTMSGNPASEALDEDFVNADGGRSQYCINLRIQDHGEFVETVFNKVAE